MDLQGQRRIPVIASAILYDGLTQPLPIWTYAFGIGALVLLAGCLVWRLTGRALKWYVPLVIALIGVFAGGVPIWDQLRVRRLAASADGLKITRGEVTQVWHIAKRTRDMSSSSLRYRTTVSEGFDVGANRFSWKTGSCLSSASLCNLAESKQRIVEGMAVKVRWFEDSAQGNEHRVVQLRKLELAAPETANQGNHL